MKLFDFGVILLITLALVGGWFFAKNYDVKKKTEKQAVLVVDDQAVLEAALTPEA